MNVQITAASPPPLFFTHCFTAVHRPLSLTVVSAVWWWCEAAATTYIIIYISIYIPNYHYHLH